MKLLSTRLRAGIGASIATVLLPLITSAQGYQVRESSRFTDFASFVAYLVRMIEPLVAILFAATLVYFLWGGAEYVRNAEDSDGRIEGRTRMIWGVVALAVISSMWALVGFVVNTLSR